MFSQWFDRLISAPLEGGACLVADILRRAAQSHSQALALPFRVLVASSVCDWKQDERPLIEQFITKIAGDGKGDAVPIFTE